MLFIHLPVMRYRAMAVFPFIFIGKKSDKHDAVLINHEKIHHAQQLELLIIPFYLFYLLNYLFNLFRYLNHDKAYRNIIFEKEPYHNEKNLRYLETRKMFAFTRSRFTV